MHRNTSWIAAGALFALLGCSKSPAPTDPPTSDPTATEEVTMAPTCIETWSLDTSGSVLEEQRSVGPHASDFFTRYPAAYLDPDVQQPVKAVERYQMGGTPLLWFTEDKAGVVVNAAVLTDLTVAEVATASAGDRFEIGALTELGLGRMSGRELTSFLLHARVIGTYIHLGSELCLASETASDDGAYEASITGEHTFFTSEENVVPLAFVVQISAEGAIAVQVGEAR